MIVRYGASPKTKQLDLRLDTLAHTITRLALQPTKAPKR